MNKLHGFLAMSIPAAALVGVLHAASPSLDSAVIEFRDVCGRAMDRMMNAMAAPSTNDVDRDFVQMMVPHHQAAIDMARAELEQGKSEQLRRIAQEIIVDQQQEIAVMRIAVGGPTGASQKATHRGAEAPRTEELQ